jgi:6,7-dimethyl-8-ribityllumazine synthase
MATKNQNLSENKVVTGLRLLDKKIALVVAQWNSEITHALSNGAIDTLIKSGVAERNIHKFSVPGSFELPHGAKTVLSGKTKYDAVICVGCIVRGETAHFDYVAQGVTYGIQKLNIEQDVPVVFCVLTDDTIEQSKARSGGKHGNKGDEAAATAIQMIQLKAQIK